MQMALRLNDMPTITEVFQSCTETAVRRQVAFMLARQQVWLDLEELLEGQVDDTEIEVLTSIISNVSPPEKRRRRRRREKKKTKTKE